MTTILIQPKDESEFVLLSELLKKMRVKSKVLTEEEQEDFYFGKAMEEGLKTKVVSKDKILKALKR